MPSWRCLPAAMLKWVRVSHARRTAKAAGSRVERSADETAVGLQSRGRTLAEGGCCDSSHRNRSFHPGRQVGNDKFAQALGQDEATPSGDRFGFQQGVGNGPKRGAF